MNERRPYGVLDTSVVIDLSSIAEEELPLQATITTITLAELSQGPHMARDDRERAVRLERLQLAATVYRSPLPFDAGAARKYGSLVALTIAAGRRTQARRIDLMIAAIAALHGLPLFTRNGDYFVGLEEQVTVVTL